MSSQNISPLRLVVQGLLLLSLSLSNALLADVCTTSPFHDTQRQRDFEVVQRFVNSKRTIPQEQKTCDLTLSGDVRFSWASVTERLDGQNLRGHNGIAQENDTTIGTTNGVGGTNIVTNGTPFGNNIFEVEFNLYLDYICDRAWGVAWVEFANDAGIETSMRTCGQDPQGLFGSGCCSGLCLKKAYFGYNLLSTGCDRVDIEIGRRPTYNIFDSRVQFQANFDGIFVRWGRPTPGCGDFYWSLGACVVDERADHYRYLTEIGFLNICNTGFDFKYSFNDWATLASHKRSRCVVVKHPAGFQFRISQITVSYLFEAEWLCLPVKMYGAVLVNHTPPNKGFVLPNKNPDSTMQILRKNNVAAYGGFVVGKVCRAGDWALDINYQMVQAWAVPDADVSGIGAANNLLGETITSIGRGFANYQGMRAEGLYALTDNFSMDAIFEYSVPYKADIGGRHSYSLLELSGIYAF